jgi:hypothetical protein
MKLSKNQYFILFLAFVSFILLVSVFKMIVYLSNNSYIVECFGTQIVNEDITGGTTSHTVDLPLTTTYSCKNFCGPTSRCSMTGQQCFTDIDCPGCQPYSPPLPPSSDCIPGNDDAGKLTWGVTPQYSPLTNGYGTKELIVTNNVYSKPSMANFGVDVWKASFDEGKSLFDKRYVPPNTVPNMPNYPERYSLSGEFIENGPFSSNAYLP